MAIEIQDASFAALLCGQHDAYCCVVNTTPIAVWSTRRLLLCGQHDAYCCVVNTTSIAVWSTRRLLLCGQHDAYCCVVNTTPIQYIAVVLVKSK